ncbi:MAG: HAD-IB family phosphatase [Thermoplasmataceae archaeon]
MKRLNKEKLVILCDFDGTISTVDTMDMVLKIFSSWSWEQADDQYQQGKLGYRDWIRMMEKPFSNISANREVICSVVIPEAKPRSHFGELVDYSLHRIPLIIVSLGIDFIINQVLELNGWDEKVQTCMPKTSFNGHGFTFEYPELRYADSLNLKDDAVKYFKTKGYRVVYIGDGTPDYRACTEADIRFTVKGSRLSELCRINRVSVRDFTDFEEVLQIIKKIEH